MRRALAFTVFGLMAFAAVSAQAHEFRPTVLRADIASDGPHVMLWKWDGLDPRGIGAETLAFPNCEATVRNADDGTERLTHFTLECGDAPLVVVFPEEIPELVIDLRVDGAPTRVARLVQVDPTFDVSAMVAGEEAEDTHVVDGLAAWLVIGGEHIIFGPDHLCFVLALTLLVGRWRRIALVVTGFTIGHSITLSGAALGVLPEPSSAPVEAVIALSITYLAVELTRDAEARRTFGDRIGLFVSTGFGLIHGFGFAGALSEIGLPPGNELMALAGFNLGVEIGQIGFVLVVLALAAVVRKVTGQTELFPRVVRLAAAYGLGAISICWLLQRTSGIIM